MGRLTAGFGTVVDMVVDMVMDNLAGSLEVINRLEGSSEVKSCPDVENRLDIEDSGPLAHMLWSLPIENQIQSFIHQNFERKETLAEHTIRIIAPTTRSILDMISRSKYEWITITPGADCAFKPTRTKGFSRNVYSCVCKSLKFCFWLWIRKLVKWDFLEV